MRRSKILFLLCSGIAVSLSCMEITEQTKKIEESTGDKSFKDLPAELLANIIMLTTAKMNMDDAISQLYQLRILNKQWKAYIDNNPNLTLFLINELAQLKKLESGVRQNNFITDPEGKIYAALLLGTPGSLKWVKEQVKSPEELVNIINAYVINEVKYYDLTVKENEFALKKLIRTLDIANSLVDLNLISNKSLKLLISSLINNVREFSTKTKNKEFKDPLKTLQLILGADLIKLTDETIDKLNIQYLKEIKKTKIKVKDLGKYKYSWAKYLKSN